MHVNLAANHLASAVSSGQCPPPPPSVFPHSSPLASRKRRTECAISSSSLVSGSRVSTARLPEILKRQWTGRFSIERQYRGYF
jgi:hypothetical protein